MINLLMPLFLMTHFAWGKTLKKYELSFKSNKKIIAELAVHPDDRFKGLMHRTSLGENEGMLFKFDYPQLLSFWTKNTFIALSIAYMDKNRIIKEIHQMEPVSMMAQKQDIKHYPSECRCLYALEVNRGWFANNNIKEGDRMDIKPLVKK